MQKITAFACDFCKKLYRTKSGGKRHEDRCFFNPATHSCVTCKHIDYIPCGQQDGDGNFLDMMRICTVNWETNYYGNNIQHGLATKCLSWSGKVLSA